MNEFFLICQLILVFGGVFISYALYNLAGLFGFSLFCVVLANIEVQMQVTAFGMDMTLGNILFAATFLVTDVISEIYGKDVANRCVNLGINSSLVLSLITQGWLQVIPNSFDYVHPSVVTLFGNTPRIIFASLLVYAIVQKFDVWAYHKWWEWTAKKCGDYDRYLWVRNNFSTLISQAINAFLFTYIAFYGVMENLNSIAISTYIISFVLALLDTPVVYACKKWHEKHSQF